MTQEYWLFPIIPNYKVGFLSSYRVFHFPAKTFLEDMQSVVDHSIPFSILTAICHC